MCFTHELNMAMVILWNTGSRIFVYKVVFIPLLPLRREFTKFHPFPHPEGMRLQKHVSENNSASNCLTMKKLPIRLSHLNTKKLFPEILEFLTLSVGKGYKL